MIIDVCKTVVQVRHNYFLQEMSLGNGNFVAI
jgi:hypothetical protein